MLSLKNFMSAMNDRVLESNSMPKPSLPFPRIGSPTELPLLPWSARELFTTLEDFRKLCLISSIKHLAHLRLPRKQNHWLQKLTS